MDETIAKPEAKGTSLAFFSRPWRKPARRTAITAVDLEGQTLRLVYAVRRSDGPEIVSSSATSLDRPVRPAEGDPVANGRAVAEALRRLGTKPGPVVMGIPRNLVMLRTLVLPSSSNLEELASMVHFQLSKDLPFRLDEAAIDFQVQRSLPATRTPPEAGGEATAPPEAAPPASSSVEVLVALVKNEVVQLYNQTAAAAGLRLVSLGLGASANARCVTQSPAASGHQAVALVSLRPNEVHTDVIAAGKLAFSRSAALAPGPEASQSPGDPPKTQGEPVEEKATPTADPVERITIEVVRALHSYEGLAGQQPVEKILVAGDSLKAGALVQALAKRFQIPCESLEPVTALGLSPQENLNDPGALPALGLALGGLDSEGLPLDFLHPKRPPVPRNWNRIKLMAAAAALAVVLLAGLGVRATLLYQRRKVHDALLKQVLQAEKSRPLYKDMRAKTKIIRDWWGEKHEWLDHYAYLSALLPPSHQVYLTSLTAGNHGVLHLSVQARSGEILAQMDARLRQVGYQLKPLAIMPSADKYGYGFQTSVELVLPAKLKGVDKASLSAPPRLEDDASLDPVESRGKNAAIRLDAPPLATGPASTPAATPKPTPVAVLVPVPVVDVLPAGDLPAKRPRPARLDGPGGYSKTGKTNVVGRRGRKAQP